MAGLPIFSASTEGIPGGMLMPSGGLLLPPPPGALPPGALPPGALPPGALPPPPGAAGQLLGLLPGLPFLPGVRINPATGLPLPPGDALRPGDWKCPNCGDHVFASRSECRKCKTQKPEHLIVAQPPPPEPKPPPAPTPPPEPKKPPPKWPIFIGNISYETTVDEVREIFKDCKGLVTVQLASDPTGSRGFGFAEFDTQANAEEAMKDKDGTEIRGRGLRLRWGQSAPIKAAAAAAEAQEKGQAAGTTTTATPAAIEKIPVPFKSFEGGTDEEKQRKAYQTVLGTGATNMRFMMKKTGCRLQLRGTGMPGSSESTSEVLHIVVRAGAGAEKVTDEQVALIKQLLEEIIQLGKPQELAESRHPCPRGGACTSVDCTYTHPKLPGMNPEPAQSDTCRYFLIRSISVEKLHTSVQQGVWATCRASTEALQEAYEKNNHVILVFFAEDSSHLQGYARMESAPDARLFPSLWGQKTIGETFRVRWLKSCMLPVSKLASLKNSLNDNLPLQKSEDGQELSEHVAEACMRLMFQQGDEDFLTLPTDVEAPFDLLFSCRGTRDPSPKKDRSRSRRRRSRSRHSRSRSRKDSAARSRSGSRRSRSRRRQPSRTKTPPRQSDESVPQGAEAAVTSNAQQTVEQKAAADAQEVPKALEDAVVGEVSTLAVKDVEVTPQGSEERLADATPSSTETAIVPSTNGENATQENNEASASAWSKKPAGDWSAPAQPAWSNAPAQPWGYGTAMPWGGAPPPAPAFQYQYPPIGAFSSATSGCTMPSHQTGIHAPGLPGMVGMPGMLPPPPGFAAPYMQAGPPPGWQGHWRPPI